MKVAVLGPRGTYTHQAAEDYFRDYEPVFCSTIEESLEADADAYVIPFENSLGGGVGESVDLLRNQEVEVTGEQLVRIQHCLVSGEDSIEDIETVRSHPQALTQCGDLISDHGWEQVESSSTAKAAQEIEEGEAAIASRLAGEINGLNIIDENVQDTDSNVTRFLVVGGPEETEKDKTSLILEPGVDRPGLLHSMLGCFAGHGINLSHIQSRPTKNRLGEYFFYVEAEKSSENEDFERAVRCLETYCEVDILGSYRGEQVEAED